MLLGLAREIFDTPISTRAYKASNGVIVAIFLADPIQFIESARTAHLPTVPADAAGAKFAA